MKIMLSMHTTMKLRSEHREHGWALRAIGQDLADVFPVNLEVEFTGREYVVRGYGRVEGSPPAKKPGALRRWVGKLRPKVEKSRPAEQNVPFERRYSLAKIHSLAEQGKSRRKNHPIPPDIHILSERLRAVGKIVESKQGQLLSLSMDSTQVAVKYRDAKGQIRDEEHSTPGLYRSQKASHVRRLAGKERCPWNNTRK
jgi:hypothetical protein